MGFKTNQSAGEADIAFLHELFASGGTILSHSASHLANWGGSAVDPLNGELYVVAKNMPVMLRVELTDEDPTVRTGRPHVPIRKHSPSPSGTN